MNGPEILRIVDSIHRDKAIDKEIVFEGIEQAIISAGRKHYGEESDLNVSINRTSGNPSATLNGAPLDSDELGDLFGRIAAQTARQVMIQKIKEAERDSLFDEFAEIKSHLVTGTVTRLDHGVATVNLGKVEALLPKSEQIPGDTHKVGERVRCVVIDVRKSGSRVKIVLSRTHPDLVRRLFESEIPEVSERIIEVRSLAREAGYRSKVAVSCYDNSIDCVGACVGVRGSRIKSIVEELAGERIDIIRWNDSLQVLIPNALQPAEVEDVILCPMLGRVIVLVREDQLSLAIGKRGQNVRLASKLVGWDIEVMTRDELNEQLERSLAAFTSTPHVTDELAEMLVTQGFFSFDDLSVIEPDQLLELSGLTEEQCEEIVAYAEKEALKEEKETEHRKSLERQAREAERKAQEIDAMITKSAPGEHADETQSVTEEAPSEITGEADGTVPAATEDSDAPADDAVVLGSAPEGEQPSAVNSEE